MTVGNFLFSVHAFDVRGNEIHGSRAKESHHGNDIIEILRLHLQDVTGHAVAFKLEDTCSMPLAKKFKRFWIVGGNVMQIKTDTVAVVDQIAGALHDGQCGQT